MNLASCEKIILQNIGYDRYSALSVDTNAEKIEDFANIHTCVNLAREEIKLNTNIPALNKLSASITTIANQATYSLPSDFDIPVKFFYESASSAWELEQIYVTNIPESRIIHTTEIGSPLKYLILDNVAGIIQVLIAPTPSTSGEIFAPVYKPILTTLTAPTDEDIIMKKYPKTVIDFATAFAFQIIKKDEKMHDKYYALGMADSARIDLRETKADSSYKELPPASIRNARSARLSK